MGVTIFIIAVITGNIFAFLARLYVIVMAKTFSSFQPNLLDIIAMLCEVIIIIYGIVLLIK